MSSLDTLVKLPSSFYRISLKALILNDAGELLLVQNETGDWEVPGGGWEHDESLAAGINRELMEELSVSAAEIGPILFAYQRRNLAGIMTARFFLPVKLASYEIKPADGMLAARFVSRTGLMDLPMEHNDAGIKDFQDQIWP